MQAVGAAQKRIGEALAEGGFVYLETARQERSAEAVEGWETLRDKTLGEVRMRLLKKI